MGSDITIGMDMGDKNHSICVLDSDGDVLKRNTVTNTADAIRKHFSGLPACRVALEAGTHSGWVSRLLEELGHEVLVGNPRKLRAIWDSEEKTDTRDAEMLARIARVDPHLLYPIRQRSAEAQIDLSIIKSRDVLVRMRSSLCTHVRSMVKSQGQRIGTCSTESFHRRAIEVLPGELQVVLEPVIKSIGEITARIRHYDTLIERISAEQNPATRTLRAKKGVGPVTALAYHLTLESPTRFENSRQVGAFLGLVPRRDQSGKVDKHLGITKAGNTLLRRLLVGCSQYIHGIDIQCPALCSLPAGLPVHAWWFTQHEFQRHIYRTILELRIFHNQLLFPGRLAQYCIRTTLALADAIE